MTKTNSINPINPINPINSVKDIIAKIQEENKKNEDIKEKQNIQLNALFQSIKQNYIYFIAVFFCLYKFKQNKKYNSSYIQLFGSFIAIATIGHITHLISHHINCTELYKNLNLDNLVTRNYYSNKILNFICNFLDFHDQTHHDLDVNKQFKNIVYEFCNNLVTQGLAIALFIKFMDIRVILLWAFMYASVHNINYLYVKPSTHRDHHINPHTNYGIDFMDIILNTKYDWNDIEEHNHMAINLLIISYVISYFTE
jgi:hypothetical protein